MQTTPETKRHHNSYEVKMPEGMPYIVSNELAETASTYGMQAILIVFMTQYLLFTGPQAMVWYHNYVAIADILTIIGAIIADVFLGKYRTIYYSSIIYCFGHIILAIFTNKIGLACGLVLIAIGSAGIVPCVFAHLGDQFDKHNSHLMHKGYSWFYLSINVGSLLLVLLLPYLLDEYNAHFAFLIPGVCMAIAMIIFCKGEKIYVAARPVGLQKYIEALTEKENLKAIGNLAIIFAFGIVFDALYDQASSSWIIQAEQLNRNIDLGFTQITILPAQILVMNPILILIFIPLFTYKIYPFIQKFTKVTHLRKMATGFFLIAASFAVVAYTQTMLDHHQEMGVIWQVLAFILLTAAEILVYVTGIEMAYIYAPRAIKSLVFALYEFAGFLGNELTAAVNNFLQDKSGNLIISTSDYFWYFTYTMLAVAVAFVFYIPRYKGKVYLQKMKTFLPIRSIEHYARVKKINEIIAKIAEKKAAYILLLGAVANRHEPDATIATNQPTYHFLIITKLKKYAKPEKATELKNKILTKLVKRDIGLGEVTITIESLAQFNLRTESNRVLKEGILLYDMSQIKLSEPKQMTKSSRLENAQKDYRHWYSKGINFLKTYRIIKNQLNDNGLLAFFLHQATESFYNCSLMVLAGDKPHSHELQRLNDLLCLELSRFANVFPLHTPKEKECFSLLESSYIDSRYNTDYSISREQLEYLAEKIEDLKELTKEVCDWEIDMLASGKTNNMGLSVSRQLSKLEEEIIEFLNHSQ
jgi:POT family proton-dependent oligopeptide transporter